MLDLTANRYGCRPSDLLEIEDSWTAINLDFVCAYVGAEQDHEYKQSLFDVIQSPGILVARALGAKIKDRPRRRKRPRQTDELQTVDEVLAGWGGTAGINMV